MIVRRLISALALTVVTPAHASGVDEPANYAKRVLVTPSQGSSLQSVDLPASVLIAARSADLADVRAFDAQGQAVPIALLTTPATRLRQSTTLPVLPIMGAADALTVTGVSLKIDGRQRASVVRVDGTPQQSGSSQLLGILLDTRRIKGGVSAISLGVATPVAQPVTFTIESSQELKEWEHVADKVVYRSSEGVGSARIGFPARDLHESYLRVTWRAESRLLAPVVVRSAAAETILSGNAPRPRVELNVQPSADRHAIEFTLPFAAPVAALEIVPSGTDTVLPIRILGRTRPDEPWKPIASGSLFRVTRDGRTRVNDAFEMRSARFRTLRIEADARTAGFSSAPKIAARLQPARVLFLTSGSSPVTLAAGRADALPMFLPVDELAKATGSKTTVDIPKANVASEPDPTVNAMGPAQGPSWIRVALWGILLGGTALLAAMVWLLMGRRNPAPQI